MTPAFVRAIAAYLDRRLSGTFLGKVQRPDPWTLGLELDGGLTLGFCWESALPSFGLCRWVWPKGSPEEILSKHLRGTRVTGVSAVVDEPILRFGLAGSIARAMVWEAIGRSANACLLGDADTVLWSGRLLRGPSRTGRTGEAWVAPPRHDRLGAGVGNLPTTEEYLQDLGPKQILSGLISRGRAAALAKLDQRVKFLNRKSEALREDRREGEGWIALESIAQALVASGNLNRRGESTRIVIDYTRDPPGEVSLDLDPAKSVRENAELFFKKVQKGKARLAAGDHLLREVSAELSLLPSRRASVEGCLDLAELYPEGTARRRAAEPQARRSLPPGVASVPLPKGFTGYAGKNASGNDTVSFKMGRGGDFWFHAEDYAGCHVVVRCPPKLAELPFDVEQAAALYAAVHSGVPPGNRVAVTASRCKFLRRVPGALGRVMVSSHRTVFVDLPGPR